MGFQPKKVSIPLAIGIFIIPLIFAWFTLRKGYSNTARILSFGWLILAIVVYFAVPQSALEKRAFNDTEIHQKHS
ncbi:TPA: hypothetical protein U2L20_001748 [Acinetobacter baumannii]|uniref:hypothetical protein n=1 Tax=Acinetobacter ursingii TaxID=108980 RepID=UPI000CC7361A|nr:hypothetical protein CJ183_09080 [Acinetobacter ursingii]HEM7785384.1 hypothetical protein [Acinetobacter baumannii]